MAESSIHALTLRMSVTQYEPLRMEAFARRVPISEVIREAVEEHLASRRSSGCDVCGKPSTHVTTPGGLRGCDDHLLAVIRPGERR